MKRLIYLFLFSFVFSSCESQSRISDNKCEKHLHNEIIKNWVYHSEGNYYVADKKFLNDLDSGVYSCIFGKDTSYVSNLFGKYYSIQVVIGKVRKDSLFHAMEYNISAYDIRKKNSGVNVYQFYIDKNGIVRKAGKNQISIGWID